MPAVPHGIDQSFVDLPRVALADAALGRARELGVAHADFRLERIRSGAIRVRDNQLETSVDGV